MKFTNHPEYKCHTYHPVNLPGIVNLTVLEYKFYPIKHYMKSDGYPNQAKTQLEFLADKEPGHNYLVLVILKLKDKNTANGYEPHSDTDHDDDSDWATDHGYNHTAFECIIRIFFGEETNLEGALSQDKYITDFVYEHFEGEFLKKRLNIRNRLDPSA